jgi:hypothetical protein
LAFWVYSANRKAKINRIFFVFTLSLVLWTSFPLFFNSSAISKNSALWLIRLAYGTTALWLISFYFFVVYFPREGKRQPFLDKIVCLAGTVLFAISSFTNLHVKDVEAREWGNGPIFGPAKIFYFGIVFFFCLLFVWIILKKYPDLSKEEKNKIQYVSIGLSIFILLNVIFNVLLPLGFGELKYYPLGNYSTIFLLGFTAFAIAKKELFGIRVVLTQILVSLMGIVLAIVPFFMPSTALKIGAAIVFAVYCFIGYLLIKSSLREINAKELLEQKVQERTKDLQLSKEELEQSKKIAEERAAELEKWYKLTIGREVRMAELKEKIKEMEEKTK